MQLALFGMTATDNATAGIFANFSTAPTARHAVESSPLTEIDHMDMPLVVEIVALEYELGAAGSGDAGDSDINQDAVFLIAYRLPES